MLYSVIADAYEKMEATTKRLELTDILADLLKKTPKELIDKVVYLIQGKLCPDYLGVEIGVGEKLVMRAISMATGMPAGEVERLFSEFGDLGEVAARSIAKKTQATLFSEPLTVKRVYDTLWKMAHTSGSGSIDAKLKLLSSLLHDASPKEAKYIVRTVLAQLRLGVADYTILDALAIAFTGKKENRPILERAYNLSSDLGAVAKAVSQGGLEGVAKFGIEVVRPIRPMLAERLPSAEEVVEKLEGKPAAAEYKLDGERVQAHKAKDEVTLFSRRLENISHHYPDTIELIKRHVKAEEAIVEGEIVAINEDSGEYLPFQELMHRRRKYKIDEAMKKYPIAINLFDLLYADGKDYTVEPYRVRREALERIVESTERIRPVPRIITNDPEEIEKYMEQAIADGCEGLVVKDMESPYRAGAREWAWIKLKREYRSELMDTIDAVIVGAFYGKGRRAGRYGAFLLAVYDKDKDEFKTICKVGTGFTDEDLENFYKLLEPHKLEHKPPRVDSKMEPDVWFEPKFVIEVIGAEITLSPIHTCASGVIREGSGLALRFPKYIGRLRTDKAPEDATTVKEVVEMYRSQLRKIVE